MNSKGILLPNFLSLVLTVAGLVIFALALYKLYEFSVNQESENAKHLLTSIVEKVNALPAGTETSFSFQGFSENRWFLLGWNATDSSKPDRCGLSQTKGCLCICKDEGTPEACQEKGFCQTIDKPGIFVSTTPLNIVNLVSPIPDETYASWDTGVLHRGCISFPANLFELSVDTSSSSLVLTHDLGSEYFGRGSQIADRLRACAVLLDKERWL